MPTFKLFLSIGTVLFGSSAYGFHIMILIFHAINVLLAFRIIDHLVNDKPTSFISSLLWGTLPQYAGSIFWVTGSVHTITLTFVFASFLLFIRHTEKKSKISLLISLLLLIFGFYCKETAIVFLFLALVYLYKKKIKHVEILKKIAPYLVLFGGMITANILIRSARDLKLTGYYTLDIVEHLRYLIYYTIYNIFGLQVLLSTAIVILVSLLIVAALYLIRKKAYFHLIVIYLLFSLPFIIVGKAPQRYSYMISLWLFPPLAKEIKDFYIKQKENFIKYAAIALGVMFILVSFIRQRIEYYDYRMFGEMHHIVVNQASELLQKGIDPYSTYIFMNEQSGNMVYTVNAKMRGFKKLWGLRDRGVGDLIYLDDLFNFCIYGKNIHYLKTGGIVFRQVSGNEALKSIREGQYYLIRYTISNGLVLAKFNNEALMKVMGLKKLPVGLIPYRSENIKELTKSPK
jgi:hypothetical protein